MDASVFLAWEKRIKIFKYGTIIKKEVNQYL